VTPFNITLYGHPTGIHAENLVTVPWFTLESSTRRQITDDGSITMCDKEQSKEETEMINERLQHLGYK